MIQSSETSRLINRFFARAVGSLVARRSCDLCERLIWDIEISKHVAVTLRVFIGTLAYVGVVVCKRKIVFSLVQSIWKLVISGMENYIYVSFFLSFPFCI